MKHFLVDVIYGFRFGNDPNHLDMTILIYESFRGKRLTSEAVFSLETLLVSRSASPLSLCTVVRDHNPRRQELTRFLLKNGDQYRSDHAAFIKRIC